MDHILYQDVQDYFAWGKTVNPSIKIYTYNLENKVTFKIKTAYYLNLFTPETMKLLRSTKNKILKNKNGENLPYLWITEVVLIQCNVANNSYQQNSRALYTFVPSRPFGQLLDISLEYFIFLKIFDSEFSYIEVRFTDENSNSLEKEYETCVTLDIYYSITHRKWRAIQFNQEMKHL